MASKDPKPALLQTRVPQWVHDAVAQLAAVEGISEAAWMRRLIIQELNIRTYAVPKHRKRKR
jgi:hypothetical protein